MKLVLEHRSRCRIDGGALEPQHPLPPDDPRALGSGRGRVLDVGCGEGVLARELLRVALTRDGVDFDRTSIDLARQADKGSKIEYLPRRFPDPSFRAGFVLTAPLLCLVAVTAFVAGVGH